MSNIRSEDLENLLIKWNEPDLWNAFRGIVGCDGKIIFPSIDAKTYGEDRFEKQRRIIELKKDVVIKLAKEFDLDASPLFEALNIPMENIIKKTCKELGLTYAQLGEQIGYGENSVSNASRGEVSKAMQKAIELYLKTLEQKKELEKLEVLRSTLKSILN